jgi:putative DNA primase/helicase
MSEQLQNILDRLENVTGNNGEFSARCPCHDDGTNSLCVGTGEDGRVLMKCQAGCETKEIVSAIGLNFSDLFADDKRAGNNGKSEIVATYDYHDERGEVLYQAVRFKPKDFRQRRPDGNGGWVWSMRDVRRVLYQLPELLDADEQ